jgi:hypothetical protein
MIDSAALVKDLRGETRALEADLCGHTGGTPLEALAVSQAASAWVVATVLARFCEDNQLIDAPFLAGPEGRLALARDRQQIYFLRHPERSDREWIEAALDSLSTSAATLRLFDDLHSLMRQYPLSPSAANHLIGFWRRVDNAGQLIHDFSDPGLHTSFLAEVYQDLSELDRKTYALVQTPSFIADLILDRTVRPAMDSFGLRGLRIIDPVCGSGTFLLGAFRRLLDGWRQAEPDRVPWDQIRPALTSVHGVDRYPIAVVISRFRLLMAAIKAAGTRRLSEVPELPLTIALGDSLLHGGEKAAGTLDNESEWDLDDQAFPAADLLGTGSYDAVVGNPPYITVKDQDDYQRYRSLYSVCRGKFPLTVPFIARFFELARPAGDHAGFVGLLVSNSFMKRDFGRPLIEDFLSEIDLTHVLDTSGAYIPGHGTPTVILLGRARRPVGPTVRIAQGLRGEPTQPAAPADGLVWKALTSQMDEPGTTSEWIQVADIDRQRFARHPWSLSGSTANNALLAIDTGEQLSKATERIGYYATTGSDDIFTAPKEVFRRIGAEAGVTVTIISGSEVRDWGVAPQASAFFPGTDIWNAVDINLYPHHLRRLWRYRTTLGMRRYYGTQQGTAHGRAWYSWHQIAHTPDAHPWSLTFPWVATHAHFAVLRGSEVPLSSAPVVRLPVAASYDDFFGLAAALNSSVACFWLKQYSQTKGAPRADQLRASESWEHFYEFTATCLRELPLPAQAPADRGRELDALAQQLAAVEPSAVCADRAPTRERLDAAYAEHERIRRRMIALQEELDWDIYRRYRLISDEEAVGLVAEPGAVPPIDFGFRAFEIALGRQVESGDLETEWFARHRATPVTEIPQVWPPEYREVVANRIEMIERNRNISLIERPEYKRRWQSEPWEVRERSALTGWLLNRCESRSLWFGPDGGPRPVTVNRLADRLRTDSDIVSVTRLLAGPDADLADILAAVVADEHVPYLAQLRYRPDGLLKHAAWEQTWDLQRTEDQTRQRLDIPAPPNYTSADFVRNSYWRLRGKLDVPKERFISYPNASPDGDDSLLLGWAGWDHRERAQALITLIEERSSADGWSVSRLTPLLAGLAEVIPWVRQWHDEIDPVYAQSPADAYDAYLASQRERYSLTHEDLTSWKAPPIRRGRPLNTRTAPSGE